MSASGPSARRRLLLAAASLATGIAAWLGLASNGAAANSGITITSTPCAGGGSAFCFSPEAATVTVGSTVTWTNTSGAGHTATVCTPSACPGAPANTGSDGFNVTTNAANGSTGSFAFTSAGTYHYYCTIHGYALMHGTITVTAATTSPTPSGAAPTPTARPTGSGVAPATPATGGAPGPAGGVLLVIGAAAVLVGVGARRR